MAAYLIHNGFFWISDCSFSLYVNCGFMQERQIRKLLLLKNDNMYFNVSQIKMKGLYKGYKGYKGFNSFINRRGGGFMLAVCFTILDIHCFRFLPHDYTDGIMLPRIAVSGNILIHAQSATSLLLSNI